MNEFTGFLIVFGILLVYVGIIGVCIADYIMSSLGLYRLASRRGIAKPWLAWIPVANAWTVGSIVDEYDETQGFSRKWRCALLTLNIIVVGAVILWYAAIIGFAFSQMDNMYSMNMGAFLAVFIPSYIIILGAALCAMALVACQSVCLFKVYESTVPEKALKYLILSMLVPLAEAICLLRCADKGYDNIYAADDEACEQISLFDELPEVEVEITVEEAETEV